MQDQIAELEQDEFSRRMSFRETEESLAIQQEDLEEAYQLTQEQIQEKLRKIQEAEETYKELDKAHLKDIAEQVFYDTVKLFMCFKLPMSAYCVRSIPLYFN